MTRAASCASSDPLIHVAEHVAADDVLAAAPALRSLYLRSARHRQDVPRAARRVKQVRTDVLLRCKREELDLSIVKGAEPP